MLWSSKSLVTRSLRWPVQASKPNNSRRVLQRTRREPFWLTSIDRRMPATTSTGSLVLATIIPPLPTRQNAPGSTSTPAGSPLPRQQRPCFLLAQQEDKRVGRVAGDGELAPA